LQTAALVGGLLEGPLEIDYLLASVVSVGLGSRLNGSRLTG
jgi:hypothetical protein